MLEPTNYETDYRELVQMESVFLCWYSDVPVPQSSTARPNIGNLK